MYDVHCVRKEEKNRPCVTDGPSATRKLQSDIWLLRSCLIRSTQNVIYSFSHAPGGVWTLDEIHMTIRAAEAAETISEDTVLYSKLSYGLTPDQ